MFVFVLVYHLVVSLNQLTHLRETWEECHAIGSYPNFSTSNCIQ